VIITNGGTGISLRDSAFEMVSELLVKTVDGFGELFRMVPLFPPFWVLVGLDPIRTHISFDFLAAVIRGGWIRRHAEPGSWRSYQGWETAVRAAWIIQGRASGDGEAHYRAGGTHALGAPQARGEAVDGKREK